MRTTVTLDDKLVDAAKRYAGVQETSAVVKIALQSYVQWQAGLRLAALGGSQPDFKLPSEMRDEDE